MKKDNNTSFQTFRCYPKSVSDKIKTVIQLNVAKQIRVNNKLNLNGSLSKSGRNTSHNSNQSKYVGSKSQKKNTQEKTTRKRKAQEEISRQRQKSNVRHGQNERRRQTKTRFGPYDAETRPTWHQGSFPLKRLSLLADLITRQQTKPENSVRQAIKKVSNETQTEEEKPKFKENVSPVRLNKLLPVNDIEYDEPDEFVQLNPPANTMGAKNTTLTAFNFRNENNDSELLPPTPEVNAANTKIKRKRSRMDDLANQLNILNSEYKKRRLSQSQWEEKQDEAYEDFVSQTINPGLPTINDIYDPTIDDLPYTEPFNEQVLGMPKKGSRKTKDSGRFTMFNPDQNETIDELPTLKMRPEEKSGESDSDDDNDNQSIETNQNLNMFQPDQFPTTKNQLLAVPEKSAEVVDKVISDKYSEDFQYKYLKYVPEKIKKEADRIVRDMPEEFDAEQLINHLKTLYKFPSSAYPGDTEKIRQHAKHYLIDKFRQFLITRLAQTNQTHPYLNPETYKINLPEPDISTDDIYDFLKNDEKKYRA